MAVGAQKAADIAMRRTATSDSLAARDTHVQNTFNRPHPGLSLITEPV